MEWVWKVFLAGFLATGTCGAPFVEEAPPENPPGDMMKKPDPPPPKPKPPEPPEPPEPVITYSWKALPFPNHSSFKRIFGTKEMNDGKEFLYVITDYTAENNLVRHQGRDFGGNQVVLFSQFRINDVNGPSYKNLTAVGGVKSKGVFGEDVVEGRVSSIDDLKIKTYGGPDRRRICPAVFGAYFGELRSIYAGVHAGAGGTVGVINSSNDKNEWCNLYRTIPKMYGGVEVLQIFTTVLSVWRTQTRTWFVGDTCYNCGGPDPTTSLIISEQGTMGAFGPYDTYPTLTKQKLNSVYGVNDDDVLIAGDKGTLLEYDGKNWTSLYLPNKISGINLNSVFAVSSGDYIIGADSGNVIFYKDGKFDIHNIPTKNPVLSIFAWSKEHVYALTKNQIFVFNRD